MKVWFYRLDSGSFTGRSFSGSEDAVELNTPPGCGFAVGVTDWQGQRVDLEIAAQMADVKRRRQASNEASTTLDAELEALLPRLVVDDAELAARSRERRESDQRRIAITKEMAALDAKQARIDRDLRLRPNEIGEDGKTPIQRLTELDQRLSLLRAELQQLPPARP